MSKPNRLEHAAALIDRDAPRMVEELRRLIAIDTSLPPGENYPAMATALTALFEPLGFACRRVAVPPELWQADGFGFSGPRENLIAERGGGGPPIALYAHIDAVPPGPGWTRPPFALTADGDRLYGRGTADMKGTIPCVLAALRAADAAGLRLRFSPAFFGCTDEEAGAYPGIRYLAEIGIVRGPILCLNGGAAPRIYGGSFGSIDLCLAVHGRSGHASGAHGTTVNAIEATVPLLGALMALKVRVAERASTAIAPPPGHDGPLRPRLTFGVISGGVKSSQTPALCSLIVNRRYAPEEDVEAAVAEIERVARAAIAPTGASLAITRGGHLAPVVDPDGPETARWADAMAWGFGFPRESFVRYGSVSSSDMGWAQRAGLRHVLLGGLSRADNGVHGADEFTTMADMRALARSLLAFLCTDTP